MSVLLRQFFTKLNETIRPNALINCQKFASANRQCRQLTSNAPAQYEIVDPKANKILQQDTIKKVTEQIAAAQQGRLFAVIHIAGKQFKITEGDVIVVEGYWPPESGDKLKLDKVMLLGAADFTIIGRPLVQDGLVNIYATVIEKTLSHTKTIFRKKRRKQYMNINFHRVQQTMLRINTIEVNGELNKPPEVTGHEHKIF